MDCAAGRTVAEALVIRMRRHQDPLLLVRTVRELTEAGEWGGFEVGFFTYLAMACGVADKPKA